MWGLERAFEGRIVDYWEWGKVGMSRGEVQAVETVETGNLVGKTRLFALLPGSWVTPDHSEGIVRRVEQLQLVPRN
jgi:hypothetical protein